MSRVRLRRSVVFGLALAWSASGCAPKQQTAPAKPWQLPPEPAQRQPGLPPQPATQPGPEGGSMQPPPPTPADEASELEDDDYASPPDSAPEAAPSPLPVGPEVEAMIRHELLGLERAELRLSDALSDCARACRALDSMRRSAEHICRLEPPPGRGRCDDARARVQQARRRVHRACGECQGRE